MIRGMLRIGVKLTLLAGAAFALFKVFTRRTAPAYVGTDYATGTSRAGPVAGPTTAAEPGVAAPRKEPQLVDPAMTEPVDLQRRDNLVEPATELPSDEPWLEPQAGACPVTHPVKAKLSSGIYHLPGMVAYERTQPDRCYLDELSAQADGLRKSKR